MVEYQLIVIAAAAGTRSRSGRRCTVAGNEICSLGYQSVALHRVYRIVTSGINLPHTIGKIKCVTAKQLVYLCNPISCWTGLILR